ncbi:uncharacterized protein LOC122624971 [Drosophila teissieri]|uniref:uncharacterized protein LOC122624971 n=1 Tax=Drosophila teissieri TaxID=7243 RepID=UPI001CBA58F9|nr:uncharacterized protein LOC122624971 [Drosophila teissieri]
MNANDLDKFFDQFSGKYHVFRLQIFTFLLAVAGKLDWTAIVTAHLNQTRNFGPTFNKLAEPPTLFRTSILNLNSRMDSASVSRQHKHLAAFPTGSRAGLGEISSSFRCGVCH